MLKLRSTGDEVAALQAFLKVQGYDAGPADGRWGAATDAAVRAWQAANGLEADGLFGSASFGKAHAQGFRLQTGRYRFVPAAHFTPAERGVGDVDLIVIHATDGGENLTQADSTAAWLANKAAGGSAHFIRDPTQTVQCVREKDVAWGAGGANRRGLHVEHCGKADQTAEQWDDAASRAILAGGAALVADLCKRYDIPAVRLTVAELKAGGKGIVGHADCVAAFGGSHHDPGRNWPWDRYLETVRAERAKLV